MQCTLCGKELTTAACGSADGPLCSRCAFSPAGPKMHTLDQAIALLDATKHWRLQVQNSNGRRRYECTVWANGRRVSASRYSPLDSIQAALQKLKEPRRRQPRRKDAPSLSLVSE
jgi:hypothetical protein